ncbi:glycosyltransferase family 4 protein [Roseomonas sp. WA12]
MPARCLIVCHTFPPMLGGSAGVYEALARHADGKIAVLTSRLDAATGEERPGWRESDARASYAVARIGLVRPPLPSAAHRNPVLRHAVWAARAIRLAVAVAAMARRHRATAILVCDDETVGWLVPFARRLGRRALVYCHGDDLVQEDAAARDARGRWFRSADRVIAAGHFPARQLVERYGVPAGKVTVLSNGVDLARFRPAPPDPAHRAALGLQGRRVILAPTRLVPRKGVDRLIEAMLQVRARHPDAILLVAGDGPQRAALERMAGPDDARFLGAVPAAEMPGLYALAEVVALPNRAEAGESDGVPLVLLEAGACGRPVVAGQAGGTDEAIVDGVNGLLLDGRDPGAIADAVLRLLEDGALAARLSAGGLEAARGAGWEAKTRRFLAICEGHDPAG